MAAYRKQLQGLDDLESKRASLTPEFLNLKLNTQEELARASLSELSTKTTYNVALVDLDRITGVLLKRYNVGLSLPMSDRPESIMVPKADAKGAGD